MMTDLLGVNWASVDHALVCLPQDRVEGFLDVEIHERIAESKAYGEFHSLQRVISFGGLLQEIRSHGHRLAKSLRIRILLKNLNRKRYTKNRLTSQ